MLSGLCSNTFFALAEPILAVVILFSPLIQDFILKVRKKEPLNLEECFIFWMFVAVEMILIVSLLGQTVKHDYIVLIMSLSIYPLFELNTFLIKNPKLKRNEENNEDNS